jgi:hypothetical protein
MTPSNPSHRSSISSIKSVTSEADEFMKTKIVLDETVNPIRPLRPNRIVTQMGSHSPNNSNQSSRPISHLSGEENVNVNGNLMNISGLIENLKMQDQEEDLSKQAPPKPPKPANLISKLYKTTSIESNKHSSNSHSSENLLDDSQDDRQSTNSLNAIRFDNLKL